MDYLILLSAFGTLVLLFVLLRKSKPKDGEDSLVNIKELMDLRTELGVKNAELKHLKQKIEEMKLAEKENEERLTTSFKNLANQILESNSEKFKKQNKEQIDNLLNPLGKEIKSFKEKVDQTNKDYIERNSALTQKIKSLESLNIQLSQDAVNLTKALKGDSKTQG
ncbi:MAG: DNA recombination protein RmuC, partial [Flavobacteriales bacterium]|nr:DNA recombination protein RmuC [Flavobacteriales bacterium]